MGTFTGTSPSANYKRLLNLISDGLTTSLKAIQDGDGNVLPFELATEEFRIKDDYSLSFRGTGTKIYSHAENNLDINAGTKVIVESPNIDLTASGSVVVSNDLEIEGSTSSTSSSTGAIVTVGGVGVGENLNVGSDLTVEGNTTVQSLGIEGIMTFSGTNFDIDSTGMTSVDSDTGIYIGTASSGVSVSIGANTSETTINDNLNVTGIVTTTDTLDSSSSNTGAVKIAGGVGIAKKLFIGTDLDVSGDTNVGDLTSSGRMISTNRFILQGTETANPAKSATYTFNSTDTISNYTINGNNNLLMSNGITEGQIKIIQTVGEDNTNPGTGTLSGGNIAGKITLTDRGSTVTLRWDIFNVSWFIISLVGGVFTP